MPTLSRGATWGDRCGTLQILGPPWAKDLKEFAEEKKKGTH